MSVSRTDADVIQWVLDGDVEAFGILVDRYQDEFAAFATLMTGSPDDAADVIQESLVRAYRSLPSCRDRHNFKHWLFRIVSNQCKTHLARRGKRKHLPLDEAAEIAGPDDTARGTESNDLRTTMDRALRALPADQREVLILKYVRELELREISEMMSVSIPALKMRLLRARHALMVQLEGALT